MATQNLLQRLDAAADTTGSSASASDRRIEEVFVAAADITAGQAVSLDYTQGTDSDKALKVKPTDAGGAKLYFCVGIALEAASIGDPVRVCIRGICEANVAAATVAGDVLQAGTVAGELAVRQVTVDEGGAAQFTLLPIVAVATEADTAQVATVYVLPNF